MIEHEQTCKVCADIAQFSLQVLPHDGESATVVMYGFTMVLCGLLKSWAAPACNNPIFAEIVPAHLRTLVYSFDRQATLLLLPNSPCC